MPLPHPSAGESREEFVARFMASEKAKAEFPDREQRLAVAFQKWKEQMKKSTLSTKQRNKLPKGSFAEPEDRSYPIEDEAHARNALARVVQHGSDEEVSRVVRAVHSKFPGIEIGEDLLRRVGLKKAATLRRITDASITRIALCKRGKNRLTTLFKSDGTVQLDALMQKATPEGELLAVVYAPELVDEDGDFAGVDVIKAMAHEYLRDHRNVEIEHDGDVLSQEDAYVAESFIVAKGDERFQGWKMYDGTDAGDLTGAWAVKLKIENPELRKAYADGGWDGVSMFGRAAVEHVDIKAAAKKVADRLGGGEIKMDEAKLKEILAAFKSDVLAEVKKSMQPAKEEGSEKNEPAEEAMPEFTGDVTNATDLENFEKSLKAYEFRKAVKSGKLTSAQIAEMRKALSEPAPSDKEAGIEAADSAEVRELKKKLFKAQRRTNAPESKGASEDSEVEVAKANQEEGLAIAKLWDRGSSAGSMRLVNKNG